MLQYNKSCCQPVKINPHSLGKTMKTVQAFLHNILYHGDIWCPGIYHPKYYSEEERRAATTGKNLFWPDRILKPVLHELYLNFCREKELTPRGRVGFGGAIKRYAGFDGIRILMSTPEGMKYAYQLPRLNHARKIFEQAVQYPNEFGIRWPDPNTTIPERNETLFCMQEDDLLDAYLCDIVPSRSETAQYLYNGGAPTRRSRSPQASPQSFMLGNILGRPELAHAQELHDIGS